MNTSNSSIYHKDEGGCEIWCLDGRYHREDGPAVIYSNGDEYWYQNGKLHREDGPAVIYSDGTKFWYLNGKRANPEDLPCDYEYIKLKYLL